MMRVGVDLESGSYEQFSIPYMFLTVIVGAVFIALGLHTFLLNPMLYIDTLAGLVMATQAALSGTAFVVPPVANVLSLVGIELSIAIGAKMILDITKIHKDHYGNEYIGLLPSREYF